MKGAVAVGARSTLWSGQTALVPQTASALEAKRKKLKELFQIRILGQSVDFLTLEF